MSTATATLPPAKHKKNDSLTIKKNCQFDEDWQEYAEYTRKAIAKGELTGDFSIDRHILPQLSGPELDAELFRMQAENPGEFISRKA